MEKRKNNNRETVTFKAMIKLGSHIEAVIIQAPHVVHCFPAPTVPLEMMIANLFWQGSSGRVDYSAQPQGRH